MANNNKGICKVFEREPVERSNRGNQGLENENNKKREENYSEPSLSHSHATQSVSETDGHRVMTDTMIQFQGCPPLDSHHMRLDILSSFCMIASPPLSRV